MLVADDDEETLDVPLNVLPHGLREGTVLRVTESEGHPLWASAMLDEELRLRRLRQAETALNELKSRDPGGDIVLRDRSGPQGGPTPTLTGGDAPPGTQGCSSRRRGQRGKGVSWFYFT